MTVPRFPPPLDPHFRPAAPINRAFREEVRASGAGVPLAFGLERPDGSLSRFETQVFAQDHPRARANIGYAERIYKFLLWQRGACRVHVGGPRAIGEAIRHSYAPGGARQFDAHFMGQEVYGQAFTVTACDASQVPAGRESRQCLGRHLDGCRLGFDLGASDHKIAAVVDGRVVYSRERPWEPATQSDPHYHYREILAALREAASQMPRVDAIGGSAAGIYIENQPRIASLFRGVPQERYDEVRTLFLRLGAEMGVPLEVLNDGEVSALAGSMSLEDNGVLGIALGSSEAAGYVGVDGCLTGWLNELAFAPIDYSPEAPRDEWSGDRGCGALYLSQQCAFRLAPRAGLQVPAGKTNAEKLEFLQAQLEAGHAGAVQIWQCMGVYLGYALAHYAEFYELQHTLLLGRCTSGTGGQIILEGAREVLRGEFPELSAGLQLHLPDEKSRRVGQAIAAASLPRVERRKA